MSDTQAFASTREALGMLRAAMGYLAAADPTALAAEAQAECLVGLEQVDAVSTAARAGILGAFTAGQGYRADGDYSPRSWLIHRTRITRGAAAGHVAWARRAAAHPRVVAALAGGQVPSESYARKLCEWTDKLPGDCRDTADAILVTAAKAGADLTGLAELAAEMYARSRSEDDGDAEPAFEDRQVTVETTFGGAGVLNGDLTPECAAVVTTVLESLAAPGRGRGHPDQGTAVPRWIAGGDALTQKMHRDFGHISNSVLPARGRVLALGWRPRFLLRGRAPLKRQSRCSQFRPPIARPLTPGHRPRARQGGNFGQRALGNQVSRFGPFEWVVVLFYLNLPRAAPLDACHSR